MIFVKFDCFLKSVDYSVAWVYNTGMDKNRILQFIKGLAGVRADAPFARDADTLVFRHVDSEKWFGVYMAVPKRYFGEESGSEFCLALKCAPPLAEMLMQTYRCVYPAWHMNKRHWITVRLNGDVPSQEIENLIVLSYDLTLKKPSVKKL